MNRTLRPSGNNFDRLEDDNINKDSNITSIKNYLESIKKVRGIMKKIKKSPKKKENMSFLLELSCPTRWNTVVQMLNSFKKSLPNINLLYLHSHEPLPSEPTDMRNIEEIIILLTPFTEGILQLSKNDCYLADGILILEYIEDFLSKNKSTLGKLLYSTYKEKYSKRYGQNDFLINFDFLDNCEGYGSTRFVYNNIKR